MSLIRFCPLDNSEYYLKEEPGPIVFRSEVVFYQAKGEHFGEYTCTAINSYGSDSMDIYLVNKCNYFFQNECYVIKKFKN